MKKVIVWLMCVLSGMSLYAQQDLGIRNSNYAGIQGALLNPSSIADSKLKWDVNVLSVNEVFDNTFLYAPKSSLNFLGVKRIIKGSIDENLFNTNFDAQNPNKRYDVSFSTEALGPSFFIKIAKKHSLGFTMAARGYANIRNITGNLGQNAFLYFFDKDLWNTALQDNSANVNFMGWLQYGLHYATVIYSHGRDELKVGLSINYLQGIAAAYATNTHINYQIVDTTHILFTNTSVDYGRTNFEDISHHDYTHGHGWGADIGFTYVHLKDPSAFSADKLGIRPDGGGSDYVYRIGLSLIDIGSINYNSNTATYHLQADNADFANWHKYYFSTNTQLDQTLSSIFYNGDSTKSLTGNHFNMALPAALSIQADWNICGHYFINSTIIKGFGHGNNPGVVRPDIYSVTPRYETKWGEVSLPMSLISYGHTRARLGIAARYRYFFIGGDAPGPLLKINNLEGADVYAGIHFFIAENTKKSSKP